MSRSVGRADRIRDLVALALVLAGVGLYMYAGAGMRALAAGQVQGDVAHPLMAHWDRYWKLSRLGLVLAGTGVAVGIWSFVRLVQRRPAPESIEP